MPGDASRLQDVEPSPPGSEPGSPRFVVCGDNALARRLVCELMDTYNVPVTVIVRSTVAGQAPEIAELEPENGDPALHPVVIRAPRLSQDVFRRAGVEDAAAVALVDQDDVANVDAALIVREVSATVRMVVRIFNPVLGEGITAMLGDCGVLSGSEFAAPAFVAATLGDDTPTYVRLPDQLLMAAKRAAVDDPDDDDDVLCGLAITGDGDVVQLPADEYAADLVLVRAPGAPRRPPRRRRRHPLQATRLLVSRNLRLALAVLGAVLVLGTAALAYARHIGPFDAGYLTILTALGAGNADLGASGLEKMAEILLVLGGVALIPTVTALVVDVVVNARLALAAGGLTEPVANHIIVVGLGNVGTRVIQELHDFGLDVVAIDRSAHARGVPVARELDIPVIIGNANSAETLRAASVETCRALVVLSTDDVTNLETALLGRAIHRQHVDSAAPAWPGGGAERQRLLRVVLRLFDGEFAERVKRAFDINQSRSVSYLAAPAFAAAMVGRGVIDTIPVGRRVLLVAELLVGAGSELEGRFCPEVSRPHEVRLIAVRTRAGLTLWSLPERRPFVRGDRLLVVATRAGLAALLARTAGVPNPPPLIELHLPLLTIHPRRPSPDDDALAPDTGTG